MLNVAPAPVIFMHTDATDMRKSFTGLCGIIRGVFGNNPADGSPFLFVNKRRDRINALRWEGDGFVIWYKRLEAVQRRKWYQRLVVIRTGIPKLACQGHDECGVVEAPGRSGWWRATATTRAWLPRSCRTSTATTCRSTASKTSSSPAAGRPRAARS